MRPSGPSRPLLRALAVALLGLGLAACADEAASPAAEASTPGDAASAEPEAGATIQGNTLEMTTIAVEDAVDDGDAAPAGRIRGLVEVSGEYASAAATHTLFVVVKAKGGAPMPRAVLRVDEPTFPLAFDIGPEQVMLNVDNPADMLLGDLVIYARLDADGSAMAAPGDYESASLDVTVGTGGHVLTIDRQR